MALPCHTLARRGRPIKSFTSNNLRDHWNIAYSYRPEHAPVAIDFRRRAQRFRIIVGKLHRWAAFDTGHFADQADGIEAALTGGIAAPEIVGEQRSPTGAESNATAWSPFATIMEVRRAAEISSGDAASESSAKISVQAENLVTVERVGCGHKLVMGIASTGLQPFDIFIAGYIRIFAVDALPGPIGGPVGGALDELRGPERVGQHNTKGAVI